MKKIIISLFALLAISGIEAQEVTIKKGKATMSEAQYQELKRKADAYEQMQQQLNATQQKLVATTARPKMVTYVDSASYAIGRDLYNSWTQQNLGLNHNIVAQSIKDCETGTNLWNDDIARPLLMRFQSEFEKRQRAGLDKNIAEGKKFLEENGNSKAVATLPSGLQYKMLKKGNGKRPKATDRVKVHYTGTLIDGTKFDSSVDRGEPITFGLGEVIAGWTEGLQEMEEGGSYMLYVPYNLGYGEQGAGIIPPGSTLIFEINLIEINPK